MTPEIEKLLSSNLTDAQLKLISAAPLLAKALQLLLEEVDANATALTAKGVRWASIGAREMSRECLRKAGIE